MDQQDLIEVFFYFLFENWWTRWERAANGWYCSPSSPLLPPHPLPVLPPRTMGVKRKKKIKESAHPELSGRPASQSAPCTLAVSSGSAIEEGSAASAAAAAASAASAAAAPSLYMRVCVCVCVSLMKWNARIGLPPGGTSPSYDVSQLKHRRGIRETLHPSGPVEETGHDCTGGERIQEENIFFSSILLFGEKGLASSSVPPLHPSFFFFPSLSRWCPLPPPPPSFFYISPSSSFSSSSFF